MPWCSNCGEKREKVFHIVRDSCSYNLCEDCLSDELSCEDEE